MNTGTNNNFFMITTPSTAKGSTIDNSLIATKISRINQNFTEIVEFKKLINWRFPRFECVPEPVGEMHVKTQQLAEG